MFYRLIALLLFVSLTAPAQAGTTDAQLRAGLQSDLARYLAARAKPEHISAISLSVSLANAASNINVTAGTTQYGGKGGAVTPATLYQIGSNTKSFTSAAILQLEAEGKLNINQNVVRWLPQYHAWKNITIWRLLNMTSDIPTYDDVQSMLRAYAANPTKTWTPADLIAVVYPKLERNAGWLYSNTAYIMLQLIVERASGHSYASEIRRRFLNNPAIGLHSTYYETSMYPPSVLSRMTSGYFFNSQPDNAALATVYGKDMKNLSVSWAQGAGAIVSTPQDVTRWCRALYEGSVLAPRQQRELESLVSQVNGKPIARTTAQEPRGFGLGVGQMLLPKMGRIWFYEGMTLGYRVAYFYMPKANAVIAVGLNSQPNPKQDKVGALMSAVYDRLHAAGKL